MAFTVTIDQFEGPLDLMLHLIKDSKLDLFDLDMETLSDQYLAYIGTMESMHLEVASEFLSELAGLLEYKSKKLLPREKVVIDEDYEIDQKDLLVKRLIEYQKYKEVSASFLQSFEERQHLLSKPISDEVKQWVNTVKEDDYSGNPYDLIKAMQKVIRRSILNNPITSKMTVTELSLDDRLLQIKQRLKAFKGKMSFSELCNDCTDLHMFIVTFLAVLDLIKHQMITYTLGKDDEIWIVRGE